MSVPGQQGRAFPYQPPRDPRLARTSVSEPLSPWPCSGADRSSLAGGQRGLGATLSLAWRALMESSRSWRLREGKGLVPGLSAGAGGGGGRGRAGGAHRGLGGVLPEVARWTRSLVSQALLSKDGGGNSSPSVPSSPSPALLLPHHPIPPVREGGPLGRGDSGSTAPPGLLRPGAGSC